MHDTSRFVALAAITQPHGVHGRVKLKLFSESLESFTMLSPRLIRENGDAVTVKVTGEAGGAPVVAIAQIKNRNEAELWRGVMLGVPRDALPATDENEVYVDDLIGMVLSTEDGAPFGTITAIENYGASDVVVIATASGDEVLLPLTHDTFPALDTLKRTGIINPPEVLATSADEPRE